MNYCNYVVGILFAVAGFGGLLGMGRSIEYGHDSVQQFCDRVFSDLCEFNYAAGEQFDAQGVKQIHASGAEYTKEDYEFDKHRRGDAILNADDMVYLLSLAIDFYEKRIETQQECWFSQQNVTEALLSGNAMYVHAKVCAPDATIVVMGDYHGSVHSLARNVRYMAYDTLLKKSFISLSGKLKPNTYLVFLGDLADRGHYGLETWALALLLKLQNPDQVIILQGNHESGGLHKVYGLTAEMASKFEQSSAQIQEYMSNELFPRLFRLLPQALFIGVRNQLTSTVSFMLCCHGGVSLRPVGDTHGVDFWQFHPLLAYVCQDNGCEDAYALLDVPADLSGFTWDGFIPDIKDDTLGVYAGSRRCDWLVTGERLMQHLDDISIKGIYSVDGVMRGHDHLEHGISMLSRVKYSSQARNTRFWKPLEYRTNLRDLSQNGFYPVVTITSVAEIFHCDAYMILWFDQTLNTWVLQPHRRLTHDRERGNYSWRHYLYFKDPEQEQHEECFLPSEQSFDFVDLPSKERTTSDIFARVAQKQKNNVKEW